MDAMTKTQLFHLVLADIAMAMAITTIEGRDAVPAGPFAPGGLRDRWLERVADPRVRQRVTALASAGLASLQALPGADLADKARRFGIDLTDEQAVEIATHFSDRRDAVLTYRR